MSNLQHNVSFLLYIDHCQAHLKTELKKTSKLTEWIEKNKTLSVRN